jgi:hypothetical protein
MPEAPPNYIIKPPRAVTEALFVLSPREEQAVRLCFGIGAPRHLFSEAAAVMAERPPPLASKEVSKPITARSISQYIESAILRLEKTGRLGIFIPFVRDRLRKDPVGFLFATKIFDRHELPYLESMHTIDAFFRSFNFRQEKVLRWLYGIGIMRRLPPSASRLTHGKNSHTPDEVAEVMHVTPQMVNFVRSRALKKIRRTERLSALEALFATGQHCEGLAYLAKDVMTREQYIHLDVFDPQNNRMMRPEEAGYPKPRPKTRAPG